MIRVTLFVVLLAALPAAVIAQAPPGKAPSADGRKAVVENLTLDAPAWLKDYRFPQTKFTFVRIEYDSADRRGAKSSWAATTWATDFPDILFFALTQPKRTD